MAKLTLEQVKKLSYAKLKELIDQAREFLKTDPTWIKICKDYDQSPDIIDLFPIKFGDLDVSASTNHGVITLNYKLLCDGDFFKDYSYILHEGLHVFQQCLNSKPTQNSNDENYLHNPHEQESFKHQVEYIAHHFGDQEAEDYVDNLLDHHDVKSKHEKDELEAIFLKDI